MKSSSPWAWIPTLYFAQGLPYVAVMTISVIMYKRLGISNAELAFYTGWLNLPWVIKPLWSPFIDLIKTKRWWVTWMQLLIGAGWGHGVGLCQIGAAVMGEKGYTYEEILLHYYKGADIRKFY